MRTVIFFYVAALVLLVIAALFIAQNNRDYLTSIITQFDDEKLEEDVISYDETSPAMETKEDNGDCPFGFQFLKNLLKVDEPDEKAPVPKQNPSQSPFIGAIRQGNLCADSMDALEGDTVGLSPCHGQGRNQEWTFTEMKQIRNEGRGTLCLQWDNEPFGKRYTVLFHNCSKVNIRQKWQFDKTKKRIMPAINHRLCISSRKSILILVTCNQSSKYQKWDLVLTEILNIELHSSE